MKSRHIHLGIAGLCIGFLGFAAYMQHFQNVQSCPLCVLQRYGFVVLGIVCLIGALFNLPRFGAVTGIVAALSGAVVAGWQIWISRKPDLGCGIDPLEDIVNGLMTAKWFPSLFHAQGSCSDDQFRLFGLSVPFWSLLWFATFALVLLWLLFRRGKR